jgi:hypothetical protein
MQVHKLRRYLLSNIEFALRKASYGIAALVQGEFQGARFLGVERRPSGHAGASDPGDSAGETRIPWQEIIFYKHNAF